MMNDELKQEEFEDSKIRRWKNLEKFLDECELDQIESEIFDEDIWME